MEWDISGAKVQRERFQGAWRVAAIPIVLSVPSSSKYSEATSVVLVRVSVMHLASGIWIIKLPVGRCQSRL